MRQSIPPGFSQRSHVIGVGDAKELKPGAKPSSRLFGIEENPEAFDDFRRQVMQRFSPAIERLHWLRLPCALRDGTPGHIIMLRVEKSDFVHSVLGNGTWTRMDASNRELNAAEIAELAYRRGVRSAVSETVPITLDLLATDTWCTFVAARGLKSGDLADQLLRIGLAARVGQEVLPTRAAVLLFAEELGSLLAAFDSRADIRVWCTTARPLCPVPPPICASRQRRCAAR